MATKKPVRVHHRLREWRRAAGLSQEALAERLGTDQATISRYERNSRALTVDMLEQLAPVLGCRPADLLPDSEGVLSDFERRLLAAVRRLEEDDAAYLLRTAQAFAEVEQERRLQRLSRRLA